MKIQVRDRTLEFELPEKDRGYRTDITPYWEEFKTKSGKPGSDFWKRFYFQCQISDDLRGKYNSYLEPMAGLGIIASLFDRDGVTVELNDLDPICFEALQSNFPESFVTPFNFDDYAPWDDADLTFIDFNNFTIQRYFKDEFFLQTNLKKMMRYTKKFIVINDSTPFYLRYGKASYEAVSKLFNEGIKEYGDYVYRFSERLVRSRNWGITATYKFGSMAYHVLEPARMVPAFMVSEIPEDYKSQLDLKII